jgi:2-keto-4-pentenoate hydratase/2-oxohepta-3-ene-1,7-dioic acid hydratase in catechol pathway
MMARRGDESCLAIKRESGWALLDMPDAPRSVDELVRGGEAAKLQAQEAASRHEPSSAVSAGLCIPWPSKIIGIGLNYKSHAAEAGRDVYEHPSLFSMFQFALHPAGEPVRLPSNALQYDYEGELGVVMGRRAYRVPEAEALDYVWGYCNCNDLSARELQRRSTQVLLGKTLEGFLPVGPELVSADEVGDPQRLTVRTWLNGEVRQEATTSDMVFSVAELISYITQYIPLEAGDLISTGTPDGTIIGTEAKIWMKPGDVVEVEVEKLGRLVTPLVQGD